VSGKREEEKGEGGREEEREGWRWVMKEGKEGGTRGGGEVRDESNL
jgi:hypothetical protein